ncbi:MAG: hypothetical protein EON87_11825 [Brevundimonas sp.]|nr:MAG: hypothetical protein EON87_11825 [Brevundimonas sp.]
MEADYRRLKALRVIGSATREDTLHLLFMAWMHWADPPFLTGLEEDPGADEFWRAIFDDFGGEDATDAEFLHVAGMMAHIFPWALGDDEEWDARGQRMMARALQLRPDGFSPAFFEGRGEYGAYFAHQARVTPNT